MIPCRAAIATVSGTRNVMLEAHQDYIDLMLAGLNVTYVFLLHPRMGSMSINGSYTGILGMLQRNEIDFTTSGLGINDVNGDLITFGPVLMAYETGILSKRPSSILRDVDVIESFKSFDNWTWLSIGFTLLFFIFWLSMARTRIRSWLWVKNIQPNVWSVFRIAAKQSDTVAEQSMSKSVLMLVSWFLFIMTTYFLNLFASDLVVLSNPPSIDSLEDLTKSQVKPMISEKTSTFNAFKGAKPGTVFRQIYEIVDNNRNVCLISGGEGKGSATNVYLLISKVITGEVAFIGSTLWFDFIRDSSCVLNFMGVDEFKEHITRKGLQESVFVNPMGKNISQGLRRKLHHSLRKLNERGLYVKIHSRRYDYTRNLGFDHIYSCPLKMARVEVGSGWRQAKTINMIQTYRYSTFILSLAISCLLIENSYFYHMASKRSALVRRRLVSRLPNPVRIPVTNRVSPRVLKLGAVKGNISNAYLGHPTTSRKIRVH